MAEATAEPSIIPCHVVTYPLDGIRNLYKKWSGQSKAYRGSAVHVTRHWV